jgi:hypothetical protein
MPVSFWAANLGARAIMRVFYASLVCIVDFDDVVVVVVAVVAVVDVSPQRIEDEFHDRYLLTIIPPL